MTEQTTLPNMNSTNNNDDVLQTNELDSQMSQAEYDNACMILTLALEDLNPDSNQYVSHGTNLGWKNRTGTCEVELETGQDLVSKITPCGSWNMKVEETRNALIVTLSHHDSPMGETHEIRAE